MNEKEEFVKKMKARTKKFGINVIRLCESFPDSKASSVIAYQIIKSGTSTGANYRAACRGRSKSEFFSKLCIVVEEVDETQYWLEIIQESGLSDKTQDIKNLLSEASEITKIMTKAKDSTYKRYR